ncbi:hypothetical protein CR513_50504, partial [Mucuna pruriens]
MVGWAVELLGFDLAFEKIGQIKAQVLANFITKLTPVRGIEEPSKEWTLSVDGASNQRGSGTDIMLEGLDKSTIDVASVCPISHVVPWKNPIMAFLKKDEVPNDPLEAKKLRKEASKYVLIVQ